MRRAAVIFGALIAIATPALSRAQVGGLINKAKQAAENANKPSPTNDAIGQPFDAASLDGAIKGMRVFRARNAEIEALRREYLAVSNRRSEMRDKNQRAFDDFETAKSNHHSCMNEQLAALNQQNGAKMQREIMSMMQDPTKVVKYTEINQALANASSKSDTAAMRKANDDLMKLIGIDLKADTVAATKKCGGPPVMPPAIAELDRLEKQTDTLNLRIRRGESLAEVDAAKAAGVPGTRFAQMRERLQTWFNRPAEFPGKEGDLIKGRKAEIEELFKRS